MKKTVIMLAVAVVAAGAFARPHHGPGFGPRVPPPRHHYHPHHHHHSGAFLGGFVGGVIGGALVDAYVGPRYTTSTVVVQQQPVVVQQTPVVVQQPATTQVWVEGRYVDHVQPNGTVVRVWEPGHYETRAVVY